MVWNQVGSAGLGSAGLGSAEWGLSGLELALDGCSQVEQTWLDWTPLGWTRLESAGLELAELELARIGWNELRLGGTDSAGFGWAGLN